MRRIIPALISVVLSIFVVILSGVGGVNIAILLLGALFLIPIFYICLVNSKTGLLLLLTIAYFIFLIQRILPVAIPTGTIVDILGLTLFLGIVFREMIPGKYPWHILKNPLSIVLLVYLGYNLLMLGNPLTTSISGRIQAFRGIFFELIIYLSMFSALRDIKSIRWFTAIWLALAVLAGFYGIYQEVFGYADFEWRAIHSVPGKYERIFVWGHIRKFSFLSDVMIFGVLMAFTSIFIITLIGSNKKYFWMTVALVICLVSMTYSGTRTAYVMVPVGVTLFALLRIENVKVFILTSVLFIGLVGIIIGPFYSGPLYRVKSAFAPSDDASMNVREQNRRNIQPYIWTHPVGGGLFTAGEAGLVHNPGHRLAGFPPDSGYLRVAIETGFIGLTLVFVFHAICVIYGIRLYFRCQDPRLKTLVLAYLCSFFAITVANFAQEAMGQKPIGVIVYGVYAILPILNYLNTRIISKNE